MNFSAKLKPTQQPNYIFNFNIDIPIKYKSSQTHRSNPISPAKSPAKLHLKRYKLSSITPRPTPNTQILINKKNDKLLPKTNKKNTKIPKTMKQQFLEKDLYQIQFTNPSNYDKKPQPSISRKTQKITTNKKYLNQEICPSRKTVKHPHIKNSNSQQSQHINQSNTINSQTKNNVVRHISILQKLVTDDNTIKYPTDVSEGKRNDDGYYMKIDNFMAKLAIQQKLIEQQSKADRLVNTHRIQTVNDEFDLTQIREFEEISTQRKEKLNYEYLKEKILVEACVRKIQRAWRNYKTKKLLNCYSSTLSAKHLKSQLITSARSQTKGINIFKKQPLQSTSLIVSQRSLKSKVVRQNFQEPQNEESSSDESSNYNANEKYKSQQQRPFSKKLSHGDGKSEKKFFETQKPGQQSSSKVILVRPASPKISLPDRKPLIKQQQKSQVILIKKQEERDFKERQKEVEEKLKKFQQEQIRKWQSILDSIKKGKNIEVLLEKSEKYKRQLQNNLIKQQINLSAINQSRASPILFKSLSSKSSLSNLSNLSNLSRKATKGRMMTKQLESKLEKSYERNPIQSGVELTPESHTLRQEELCQTEKRREKIMFFENQILKIDNEDYSDASSVSCESFTKLYPKKATNTTLEQKEREENIKLRKKLELFNTHFLDISSADEGLTDRSLKGLKGNSTDERRNNINKRFPQTIHQQQSVFQNDQKQLSSSEEGLQNRRPDTTIITVNQSNQKPISRIHQLINRKIEYPVESSQSSPDSSLQVKNTEYNAQNSPQQDRPIDQLSNDSSGDSVSHFNAHVNKIINEELYGEPVLTHRDRRTNVPELKLQILPKKFPSDHILEQNEEIVTRPRQNAFKDEVNSRKIEQLGFNQQASRIQNEESNAHKSEKPSKKPDMQQTLKICSYIEEQLIYQGLLQFSDSSKIVNTIKCLFDNFKKQKKKLKPEGICTNLQSIKDYLENFVGYMFENKLTQQVQMPLSTPCGPNASDLLKFLRKNSDYENEQNEYIMSIQIFEKHWKYANSNIYFDRKYADQKMEQERVAYLKGLTRVYFRSIFDAFNESLEFQRVYGLTGKPYPWSRKLCQQKKKTLKSACQLAYRRILKISVVYFGVHFDDKSHLFNLDQIKELQEQRLLTLLMMELQQDEYRWNFIQDQLAQVRYDIALQIEQQILEETLQEILAIQTKPKPQYFLIN